MKNEQNLCYYCNALATYEHRLPLSNDHGLTRDEMFETMAKGEDLPTIRSEITINAYTCPEHEDAYLEACHDTFDYYPTGYRLEERAQCSDPWHTDPEAYESGRGEPRRVGRWVGQGHKCPTCGFETAKQRIIPNSITETDAYKYASRSIASRIEKNTP